MNFKTEKLNSMIRIVYTESCWSLASEEKKKKWVPARALDETGQVSYVNSLSSQIIHFNQQILEAKEWPRQLHLVLISNSFPSLAIFLPPYTVSARSQVVGQSMINWKHQSNTVVYFVIAKHFPSLRHQKLTQLLHFSSLKILIYWKSSLRAQMPMKI